MNNSCKEIENKVLSAGGKGPGSIETNEVKLKYMPQLTWEQNHGSLQVLLFLVKTYSSLQRTCPHYNVL